MRSSPDRPGAVADGRLHLSGAFLLGPWLRRDNAAEMFAAAENKTRFELEELIAERFPRTEVLPPVAPTGVPAPMVTEVSCQVAAAPPVTQPRSRVAPKASLRDAQSS